jgi:hypothetical protein
MSEAVTPMAVPVHNQDNASLVDVLQGVRYDLGNLAAKVGDLERTIRLSAVRVTDAQKESIAGLFDDGSTVAKTAAQRVRETKESP